MWQHRIGVDHRTTVATGFTGGSKFLIPAHRIEHLRLSGNTVHHTLIAEQAVEAESRLGKSWAVTAEGIRIRLAHARPTLAEGEVALVVRREHLPGPHRSPLPGKWRGELPAPEPVSVVESWRDAVSLVEEDKLLARAGLRSPQLGAVYSVLGYWTTDSTVPGSVVMPTGTGKTDTMVALLVTASLPRLLVVVPSDALREQIATKFETLGVLVAAGVVQPAAQRPLVGRVSHGFDEREEAVQLAEASNVVVTTPAALEASAPSVRGAFLERFSHLFIDEAHHVAARTWTRIRDEIDGRPTVQFTATPFREDGKHLGGRLLYAYPLRAAQSAGYFSKINFISVLDLGDHDRSIAERAVARLREDLDAGFDHVLMARASRIGRATELMPLYQLLAPDLTPVLLHSRGSARDRRAAVAALRERESRVIVCVDMLGEGFDLPSLKVAAIHDPHKSIAVTLQFIGRFARAAEGIGDASVVVGRPSGSVDPQLRRLYAEDADWNTIIRDISEGAVEEVAEETEFEAAFNVVPDEVAVRSLLPKMSTVAFRTTIREWDPAGVYEVYPDERLLTSPIAVNQRDKVAWFVTETRQPVRWGDLRTVEEVSHDLYVLYWNQSAQLLFINSSNNASLHQSLAKAVTDDATQPITGSDVYRVMTGISRLVPTNVGVLDIRNRSRRFSFHVGADVSEGFPVAEAQTKTKTNIFAHGYETGSRTSIGAALKGRIWSHRVADSLMEWTHWCDHIGEKLLDDTQDVDAIMASFIRPEVVEARPALVPLFLEWPWEVIAFGSDSAKLEYDGSAEPVFDVSFSVTSFTQQGSIDFEVGSPSWSLPYSLDLAHGEMRFSPQNRDARLRSGRTDRSLKDVLNEFGLNVQFEDEALVVPPGLLLKPPRQIDPYDRNQLTVIDWAGVDLTKESQGPARESDSIQARMLEELKSRDSWQVILDDDGTGEIADIVALKATEQELVVELVHCKWVPGGGPRRQVVDLYEVCGQVQKSTQWRRSPARMVDRLIHRERTRLARGTPSGFMVGDVGRLYAILDRVPLLRSQFRIGLAQPGLSKSQASEAQLSLLAATQVYVWETADAPLDTYCSP